jgi:hypothetical protein
VILAALIYGGFLGWVLYNNFDALDERDFAEKRDKGNDFKLRKSVLTGSGGEKSVKGGYVETETDDNNSAPKVKKSMKETLREKFSKLSKK